MSFWVVFGAVWHIIGLITSWFGALIGFIAGMGDGIPALLIFGLVNLLVFTVLLTGVIVGWGVF